MTRCYSCGNELPANLPFHRSDRCPSCDADVRVCRNCRFYEPGAQWDCREHISEPVHDKTRANFCDFFQRTKEASPGGNDGPAGGGPATGSSSPDAAREAFENLFGE